MPFEFMTWFAVGSVLFLGVLWTHPASANPWGLLWARRPHPPLTTWARPGLLWLLGLQLVKSAWRRGQPACWALGGRLARGSSFLPPTCTAHSAGFLGADAGPVAKIQLTDEAHPCSGDSLSALEPTDTAFNTEPSPTHHVQGQISFG